MGSFSHVRDQGFRRGSLLPENCLISPSDKFSSGVHALSESDRCYEIKG